jgi:hypothetical protein
VKGSDPSREDECADAALEEAADLRASIRSGDTSFRSIFLSERDYRQSREDQGWDFDTDNLILSQRSVE